MFYMIDITFLSSSMLQTVKCNLDLAYLKPTHPTSKQAAIHMIALALLLE